MNNSSTHALCTLFNSLYLDKGIVLYRSLERVAQSLSLYVLAMDDKCYEVLTSLKFRHLHPISLQDFESEKLKEARKNRSFSEYCWTCSSSLIDYIFNHYDVEYCSYIDADMAFFNDPHVLIEEMEEKGASVSIVGHRFCRYDKKTEKIVGKYCVECNTFKNNSDGRTLLSLWISQCIEDCSQKEDGLHWGDQKYMDNWVSDYAYVIETGHLGAGVAPWNISQYSLADKRGKDVILRKNKETFPLLFYHFESITNIAKDIYNIHVFKHWHISKRLVFALYIPYLKEISTTKDFLLGEYNVNTTISRHPSMTYQEERIFSKIFRLIKMVFGMNIKTFIYHNLPHYIYKHNDIITILKN